MGNRAYAESLAIAALREVENFLPKSALKNDDFVKFDILINDEPFVLHLGPWEYKGRIFHVAPKKRQRPNVGGYAELDRPDWWIMPDYFHRAYVRRKRPK